MQSFALEDSNLEGSVAEVGVYRGGFARVTNTAFPDRLLFLYDTFAGFDSRDFPYEAHESLTSASHFEDTSVDVVIQRMPYPKQVVIKQGYFSHTAKNHLGPFMFVSLDLDLYQPTLAALKFFWPRMTQGGVILVHDYFLGAYPHVRKAVIDFKSELGRDIVTLPIGDDLSVAVVKT